MSGKITSNSVLKYSMDFVSYLISTPSEPTSYSDLCKKRRKNDIKVPVGKDRIQ